jgi:hypothetical protein
VTETPGGPPPGGQVSDRMQALLSRAVEEQVSEQRAVSTLLAELRAQVAALSDGVRLAASDASVERLGGVVSTVVADQRTSTSLLGQRIEALSKRVEAVAAETAGPTEQAAVRLAALSGEIAAQADAVQAMQTALEQLAGFPAALAALQRDVAGLHDRLQPLAEVRSTLGDLGARTAHSLGAIGPQLEALQGKVDELGAVPDPERLRDAVVDALSGRLDKLEEHAERPVVGPEVLRSGLGDLRASLDASAGDRFEELGAALGAVQNRLGQVGERLAEVGDAAGGVPALATDLNRLAGRVEELHALRAQLAQVAQGVAALQEDSTATALTLGLASLRDDVQHLAERITEAAPPPVEQVAALVSQRVADRLVETLAPRIADVVLTRVSAALVTQLGEALSPRVKGDTELVVRTVAAESERRILAHVDEAVLALAEALLRRRRGGRAAITLARPEELSVSAEDEGAGGQDVPSLEVGDMLVGQALPDREPAETAGTAAPADEADEEADEADEAPVQDVVDKLNALAEPTPVEPAPVARAEPTALGRPTAKPAVTTAMAPVAARPGPAAAVAEAGPPPGKAGDVGDAGDAGDMAPEEPADRAPETASETAADRPVPQEEGTEAGTETPSTRSRPKAGAPPKKASRPVNRPPSKPILDRTPDLEDDDVQPVQAARPPRVTRPAAPPAPRPGHQDPERPPPPAGEQQAPPAPPPKRKPWWRPGG